VHYATVSRVIQKIERGDKMWIARPLNTSNLKAVLAYKNNPPVHVRILVNVFY